MLNTIGQKSSRKFVTKPKNKTTAGLGRNLLLRYRLSKNSRDLLSPAFAMRYAKCRALYSFASEKKGTSRTLVAHSYKYDYIFMSFIIKEGKSLMTSPLE